LLQLLTTAYGPEMSQIFISYRRHDDSHAAGRLYNELVPLVDRDRIFMDVDAIPPGADFVEVQDQKIATCEVLLAIIGPRWLDAKDEFGCRRIDRPDDFVRIEIAAALNRKIPVVPVLMDDALMPDAENLPDDLKALARCQAAVLSHRNFRTDVKRLVLQLALRSPERSEGSREPVATPKHPVLTSCPVVGNTIWTISPSEQDVIAALDELVSGSSQILRYDRGIDFIQIGTGTGDDGRLILPITFDVEVSVSLSSTYQELYEVIEETVGDPFNGFANVDRVKQLFLSWINSHQLPSDVKLIIKTDWR